LEESYEDRGNTESHVGGVTAAKSLVVMDKELGGVGPAAHRFERPIFQFKECEGRVVPDSFSDLDLPRETVEGDLEI
jgi:hypothetical protein